MSKKKGKSGRMSGRVAKAAANGMRVAAIATGKTILAAVAGVDPGKALAIEAHDALHDIEQIAAEEARQAGGAARGGGGSLIRDEELAKLLKTVGTAVWKLSSRIIDPETKEPKDEFRKVWRHIEAIRDALSDVGVEIVDWAGRRYDEGMSLKVVAEEERPGEKEATITETLLPTIRFRRQFQLQMGEVVVGRPGASANDGPTDANN